MCFAVEKFLQSSNGTGRKEKGLHAILFSLKKQHSLFAELLDVPLVDCIRVEWGENYLRLNALNNVIELTNPSRSLFLRMKVEVDENGNPGIPNLEPLSSFMSPNKPYRYSSEGLKDLLKREIRSTNRQLLVRWFWIESNIVDDPSSPSSRACEVIVQFALATTDLKKRRRPEYSDTGSPEIEDSSTLMRNMNAMLEKIHQAQMSHYAKVEGLLTSLVYNSGMDTQQRQTCHQLQQVYNANPMQGLYLSNLRDKKAAVDSNEHGRSNSNAIHFNLAPPDASWDSIFQSEQDNHI